MNTNCIVLAAGDGKRMHARSSKVLCEVALKPMLLWVTDAVKSSGVEDICCVISNPGVEKALGGQFPLFWQTERLGTAHAVKTALEFLESHRGGNTLILAGDAPFMDTDTISLSLSQHISDEASQTVISAELSNPHGYGRIVRAADGSVSAIVEELDCTDEQRLIKEINSGTSWYKTDDLIDALSKIKNENKKGEYYLTDTIAIFKQSGKKVGAYKAQTSDVTLGANNPADLLALNEIAINRIIDKHLANGVHFISRDGVIISPDVKIMPGTLIMPGTIISGNTSIGEFCTIGPNAVISNCKIGDNCQTGPFVQLNNQELTETTNIDK